MTPEQRKNQINKVVKCKVSECFSMSQSTSLESVAKLISIAWNDAHINHLQPSRVADLWKKAEEILSTPNFVVTAAGNASARQVASVSSASSSSGVMAPHFVYSKKAKVGIEVHCDCPVYSSTPKVCQHCLAAAKDMGVLSDYLLWVGKIKGPALNLSNLIAKEEPQSSGQKGSTNHRKGVPKGKKKPVLKELNGISNEDSVTSFMTTSVLSPSSTCSSSSPFPLASMPYVPPTSVMSPMHLPLYNVPHSLYSPPPPYQVPQIIMTNLLLIHRIISMHILVYRRVYPRVMPIVL